MAYEIKLVGENNPIMVDSNTGIKIKTAFDNNSIPKEATISLPDFSTKKGQIRSIKRVEDSAATDKKSNQSIIDLNNEDRKIYLSWKNKTPEQKAERLDLFKQCYNIIHKQFPSDEVIAALKQDLILFFTENRTRTYGDPPIYIKHFGNNVRNLNISKFGTVMFNLMERVIGNDMVISK